jgi:hypothetical protein
MTLLALPAKTFSGTFQRFAKDFGADSPPPESLGAASQRKRQ